MISDYLERVSSIGKRLADGPLSTDCLTLPFSTARERNSNIYVHAIAIGYAKGVAILHGVTANWDKTSFVKISLSESLEEPSRGFSRTLIFL